MPRNKKEILDSQNIQWVSTLKDLHRGGVGFLLGNGWSVRYYDTTILKEKGVVVGCNRAFELHPLDFVVWMDSTMRGKISAFQGIKICPVAKRKFMHKDIDDSYFFYGTGNSATSRSPNNLEIGNSGCLGLQFAHLLGIKTLFLVGCDCCVIDDHTNIFKDKIRSNIQNRKGPPLININGKKTTRALRAFSRKFMKFYNLYKNDMDIYQLGEWGILEIPSIEFAEFWSEFHPKYKELKIDCRNQVLSLSS